MNCANKLRQFRFETHLRVFGFGSLSYRNKFNQDRGFVDGGDGGGAMVHNVRVNKWKMTMVRAYRYIIAAI